MYGSEQERAARHASQLSGRKRRAWVLAMLHSCHHPKGLPSESLSMGGSLFPLSVLQSLILKKQPPGLRRPGWVIIASFLFQAYHLSKGFCFSALCGNELAGEKGKTICKLNEVPCLQLRSVKNDLRRN